MNKTIKSYNKVVGWGIVGAYLASTLAAAAETEAMMIYLIIGMLMFLFGIWGGVLLTRMKETQHQVIGWLLTISMSGAVFVEDISDFHLLALLIFGIWGAVLLIRSK